MDEQLKKIDPIRETYFKPVEIAEKFELFLFYISIIFSLTVLLVNKQEHNSLYNLMLTVFVLMVVANFLLSTVTSFYLKQSAEDKRLQDFLSKSYGISLNHEETHGYYNSDEKETIRRIGAQVLENSYFSKSIILKMLISTRIKNSIYIFLWLFLAIYRADDLNLVIIGTQVLFSEQILSRWFRLEWLYIRVQKVYESLYRCFQIMPKEKGFEIAIQEYFVMYESAKSKANITLSSKVFDRLNKKLSAQWGGIMKKINLN